MSDTTPPRRRAVDTPHSRARAATNTASSTATLRQHSRLADAAHGRGTTRIPTPTERALERHEAEIAVLVYLARCDGLFHQAERDVVDAYLEASAQDIDFDPVVIYRHICQLYPDQANFQAALDELGGLPRHRLWAVARVCLRLAAADGVRTEEEEAVLRRVRMAIGDPNA